MICKNCGKEIVGKSKNFCSLKCKNHFYYEQNKEKFLEKNKKWAKDNKERKNEQQREKYHSDENFRQKILEKNREYKQKCKEEKGK